VKRAFAARPGGAARIRRTRGSGGASLTVMANFRPKFGDAGAKGALGRALKGRATPVGGTKGRGRWVRACA